MRLPAVCGSGFLRRLQRRVMIAQQQLNETVKVRRHAHHTVLHEYKVMRLNHRVGDGVACCAHAGGAGGVRRGLSQNIVLDGVVALMNEMVYS